MTEKPNGTPSPTSTHRATRWENRSPSTSQRTLISETPVSFVINGTSAAVMMATPSDLEDFAYGFALTEGIIAEPEDAESFEIVTYDMGIEARFWLTPARAEQYNARQRLLTGPVGCGLCGVDSLEAANRVLPTVEAKLNISDKQIAETTENLRNWQPLMDETGAAHAAAFYRPGDGIILAREDVGRHNALDKLIGALALADTSPATGAFVMTSRISVELVQKSAMAGCPMLIAASSPTALAVETAKTSGIALIGFCKNGSYERYSAHR